MTEFITWSYYNAGLLVCSVFAIVALLLVRVLLRHNILQSNGMTTVDNCFLYLGRVTHSRLKGGCVHHLDYPLFLAGLDLDEMDKFQLDWWPLFCINRPLFSFCSFDMNQHLKDIAFNSDNLFISIARHLERLPIPVSISRDTHKIMLLTNLTYFGYCFNPISVYYVIEKKTSILELVVAEVSNTPWIEMHSYFLTEHHPAIKFSRNESGGVHAIWAKCFHVSPFMEMNYFYDFEFGYPAETLKITSRMIKEETKETCFTANLNLQRIPFNPRNLLYVLFFYPLQTRMIQLYIHYEAAKLYFKGAPFFAHPKGTNIDFGYGLTGRNVGNILWYLCFPINFLAKMLNKLKKK